jgi:HAD superfamily hydrolase (TIGR01549 family)
VNDEPADPPIDTSDQAAPAAIRVEDVGAFIFDLDGTLTDTVSERIEAWMRTFAEIGLPADRRHVAGLIGADGKRLAREVAEISGRTLTDERAEAIDKRSGTIFGELAAQPRRQAGATQLLEALDEAGWPWSIATSSRAEQARPMIEALDLPSQPHLTDGSHVKHAKPAPDLLFHAADQLGVPAHRCWYIGDATWDMRAARAAHMVGVAVATGVAPMETLRESGAVLAFPSLVELHRDLIERGKLPRESRASQPRL